MKTVCPKCFQEMELPDDQTGAGVECAACHESFSADPAKPCRHCGAMNPKSATRCVKCGKSIISIGIRKPGEMSSAPAAPAEEKKDTPPARTIGIRKPGEMSSAPAAEKKEKPAPAAPPKIALRMPGAPAAAPAQTSAPAAEKKEEPAPAAPPKIALRKPGEPAPAPAQTSGAAPKLNLPKTGAPPKLMSIPKPEPAKPAPAAPPAPTLSNPAPVETSAAPVPTLSKPAPAAPVPAKPALSKPSLSKPSLSKPAEKPQEADGAQESGGPKLTPPPAPKKPAIDPAVLKKVLKIAAIVILSLVILGSGGYLAWWYLNGPYEPDKQLEKGKKLFEEGKKEKGIAMLERAAAAENMEAIQFLAACYENGDGTEKNTKKALEYYRRLEKYTNPEALFAIGRFYENGTAGEKDEKKAVEYYEKAAKRGHAKASLALSRFIDNSEDAAKNPERILDVKAQAAENGDPASQLYIAKRLLAGFELPYDPEKAAGYLEKAFENGFPEAGYILAECRMRGIGCEKNAELAKETFTKVYNTVSASGEEDDTALLLQAKCLLNGFGTEKNAEQAAGILQKLVEKKIPAAITLYAQTLSPASQERMELLRESAELGDPEGLYQFGLIYAKTEEGLAALDRAFKAGCLSAGPAISALLFGRDPKKSLEYAQQSFDRQAPGANKVMADFLISGRAGVTKDPQKAIQLYWKAAQDPDDPTSEAAMEELLKLSRRKDLQEEIVKILAEAAEGGNLPAKKLMANFYRTGSGVEQNLPKAVEYYWATESLEELSSMLLRKQEPDKILELFTGAAKEGNTKLQFRLAEVYLYGRGGITADITTALEWLNKAVEGGDADAQYLLGTMKYQDEGRDLMLRDPVYEAVPKSRKEAGALFAKAAESGHAAAQYRYGRYLNTTKNDVEGVADKKKEAVLNFEKSAAQNYTPAVFQTVLEGLAEYETLSKEQKKTLFTALENAAKAGYSPALFAMGEVAAAAGNETAAREWYKKAADKGYVPALIVLKQASKHHDAIAAAAKQRYTPAVAEDAVYLQKQKKPAEARPKYERAYKDGYTAVANNIGICLMSIRRKQALKYFEEAAHAGSARAQFNLGCYFYKDEADKPNPDYTRSLECFKKAAEMPNFKMPKKLCGNLEELIREEASFRELVKRDQADRSKGQFVRKDDKKIKVYSSEKERAAAEELERKMNEGRKKLNDLTEAIVKDTNWKQDDNFAEAFHQAPPELRYPWKPAGDAALLKEFFAKE